MSENATSTADPVDDGAPGDSRAKAAVEPESPSRVAVELEERLLRALADLDNLRKRYDRELRRERDSERARVVTGWLPVIDNLELALRHAGSSAGGLADGVAAVHDQAVAVLDQLGFRRFEDLGCPFDPMRHEAVGTTDADAPPDTVVAAIRPGYGSESGIVRPAKVIVARPPR
ncbi:MAG: nucleotide exchange factor GrpE [Acidimicrobiia bacterium]